MILGNTRLILPTLIPAVLLAALLFFQWRSTACRFREAVPGSGLFLCRQKLLSYEPQTALVHVPKREGWLWGRKQVDHWVLIDAGARNSLLFGSHASSLLKAVKRALAPARRGAAPAQLELIVLTHSHAVGALTQLLAAYPEAKVAAHAEELPYLVGQPPLPLVPPNETTFTLRVADVVGLMPSVSQHGLPAERVLALLGEGGDLADAVAAAGSSVKKALRWLPRGLLSWVHARGHTPGSVALIHTPSGAMLVGDAVGPAKGWLGGTAGLSAAPPGAASSAALQAAAKRLLVGQEYRWLLPFHGGNFSKHQAAELVRSWPDEAPPEQPAQQEHRAEGRPGDAGAPLGAGAGDEEGLGGADTAAAGLGVSPGKFGRSGGGSSSSDGGARAAGDAAATGDADARTVGEL